LIAVRASRRKRTGGEDGKNISVTIRQIVERGDDD
jgi:hypothetical protein